LAFHYHIQKVRILSATENPFAPFEFRLFTTGYNDFYLVVFHAFKEINRFQKIKRVHEKPLSRNS